MGAVDLSHPEHHRGWESSRAHRPDSAQVSQLMRLSAMTAATEVPRQTAKWISRGLPAVAVPWRWFDARFGGLSRFVIMAIE